MTHRETIHWTVDDQEVPAQKDWTAAMVAPGGYEAATIMVPTRFVRGADQGSILKAFRSSGPLLYYGRVVSPPKVKQGVSKFYAQGPMIELMKTLLVFLIQARDYTLWAPRDGEPYLLDANNSAYSLDNQGGRLMFQVASQQTVHQFNSAAFVFWPQDTITNIAFTINVDAEGGAESAYQLRIRTYTGPSTILTTTVDDINLPASGSTSAYTKAITDGADMISIIIRRINADTTTSNQMSCWLTNLRINGRFVGDEMFASQGMVLIAAQVGWDDSKIAGSGYNVLPIFWSPSGNEGLDQLATQLQTYDDWRWLATEPPPYSKAFASLEFDRWGGRGRKWRVRLEHGADDQLEELEIFSQVVIPYTTLTGVPGVATAVADPNPLAYTAALNKGKPIQNIYRAEAPADRQPNGDLPQAIATTLLNQVTQRRAVGPIDIYDLYGDQEPISRYELKAGDVVTIDDRSPLLVQGRVARVDWSEQKVTAQLTQDVSAASLIAKTMGIRARR